MKREVNPSDGQQSEAEAAPVTLVSGGGARRRMLLVLLSPLALLLLLAVVMRLAGGANPKPGPGSADEYIAAQPPDKVVYVDTGTQKELEAAVGGQLSALRRRDFDGAMAFARESFRNRWSAQQYQAMIEKTGFAIMPVSSRQEFRKALQANNMTTILVTVRKADGDGAGFVYGMVQEGGKWRIAACTHALDPAIAELPQ